MDSVSFVFYSHVAIVGLLVSLAFAQAGELHQAARVCEPDRMRQVLSRHPSLNETDENGMTPLHIVIDSRQTACVGLLLEAGADRTARDRTEPQQLPPCLPAEL